MLWCRNRASAKGDFPNQFKQIEPNLVLHLNQWPKKVLKELDGPGFVHLDKVSRAIIIDRSVTSHQAEKLLCEFHGKEFLPRFSLLVWLSQKDCD